MARVTDAQVKELWRRLRKEASLKRAAMKSGMDRKTARRYRASGQLPGESRAAHTWRTRSDPLAAVWPELVGELERAPGLQAKTLLALLQQRYPEQYADTLLRTLQRRVKRWRAMAGPAKEIFFEQVHEPGRLGASDFTHLTSLGVTIQGQALAHLVYHFVLTYSNWEHVTLCFSESFASLSEGLQNALWALGGVPSRHRTDRMTLAVHADGQVEEYTANYRALMAHYGLVAEATNPASGHENGDVESSHRHLKVALAQALLVRGSRDFVSREDYGSFMREVVDERNGRRRVKLSEEMAVLRLLPGRRLESLVRVGVRVNRGSTIRVQKNLYSVPARLIGEWVEARVGLEQIEVWYAGQLMETMPRLRGRDQHRINYRHLIDWLVRKPGAFAQYRYQAALFPSVRFRQAYDGLVAAQPERASREYVRILQLAARGSESAVEAALEQLLSVGRPLSALAVETRLGHDTPLTVAASVHIEPVDLRRYDELLEPKEDPDGDPECGAGVGAVLAGIAPAGDAGAVRGSGPASRAGVVELSKLSVGVGGARMPAAAAEPRRASFEDIEVATGEELADAGSQTAADESRAATANLVEWRVSGSTGECAHVRAARDGQDALPLRVGSGAGTRGPAGAVHHVRHAGARPARGQARFGPQGDAQTAGPVGGTGHRRPGLCAAEPRGDGSLVHVVGGALRARQRAGDKQLAVLEVGPDLQGSNDDGGGHRSAGASLPDRGIERVELPGGDGQEGEAGRQVITATRAHGAEPTRIVGSADRVEPPWGAGSAAFAVAALRLTPLRQPPTAVGFVHFLVWNSNCR